MKIQNNQIYYTWSIFIDNCQTIISDVHEIQSDQIDGSSHDTCEDYFFQGFDKNNEKKLARSFNLPFYFHFTK